MLWKLRPFVESASGRLDHASLSRKTNRRDNRKPPNFGPCRGHAIVSLVLGIIGWSVTMGIGAIAIEVVYAFLNKSIVKSHYLKKGWIEV